jgi:hypothetical protein
MSLSKLRTSAIKTDTGTLCLLGGPRAAAWRWHRFTMIEEAFQSAVGPTDARQRNLWAPHHSLRELKPQPENVDEE